MAEKKMGFEGLLYYGTKGSTAATLISNCTDVTITFASEIGNTTTRNSAGTRPKKTGRPTTIDCTIEWTMMEDSADTTLAALKAAAVAGTAVALRGKSHSSGTGPDIDAYIDFTKGEPINGEQTVQFRTIALTEADRTISLNS